MDNEKHKKSIQSARLINNMNSHEFRKSLTNQIGKKRIKRNTFFLLVIILILLFVTFEKVLQLSEENKLLQISKANKLFQLSEKKSVKNNVKTILLWNSFFKHRDWYFGSNTVNETYFIKQNCPVTNCVITNNRTFLKSIDQYEAILFHMAQPLLLKDMPTVRRQEQLYVFFDRESPPHTQSNLNDKLDLFNLTATYRLDSNLSWAYGFVEDIKTGLLIAPAEHPRWKSPPRNYHLNETEMNIIRNKKKTAAWFVSRCHAKSKREILVKSLQKYIKVDIYGKCGKLKCPRSSNDECNKKLDLEYKFYFSFENSLCNDYVTEKLFSKLERFVIPVVFGGADYNRFAPPNSYINAQDFKTSKELANYLLYLSKNDEEYQKYFWWKEHYRIVYKQPYCDICTKLHNRPSEEKPKNYKNIKNWWFNQCTTKSLIKFV